MLWPSVEAGVAHSSMRVIRPCKDSSHGNCGEGTGKTLTEVILRQRVQISHKSQSSQKSKFHLRGITRRDGVGNECTVYTWKCEGRRFGKKNPRKLITRVWTY